MDIQKRVESALDRAMLWAEADPGERRRQAGVAIRDGDTKTLEELLESYLRTQGKAGMSISDHTLKIYRRAMHKAIEWCNTKALKPHNIDQAKARNYSAWLQSHYADKTVNIYLLGARRFLDALEWAGLSIDKNPFQGITVKERIDPREKADPYTTDELRHMLKAGDARDQAVTLLAADAGLRLAEIMNLKWSDVDLERKQLAIIGKGGRRRKPAMTERLTKTLPKLQSKSHGNGVIETKNGKPITYRGLQWLVESLCKKAKVNPRGIHNLRHSCGTRLYGRTRDMQAVARHLGHSTTKTSELYAHLADSDYRAAVAALDENGIDADDTGE